MSFDIPAENLSTAITKFSNQTHFRIIASENLAGRTTRGLAGTRSIGEGLTQLLAGTGLSYMTESDTEIRLSRVVQVAHDGAVMDVRNEVTAQSQNSGQVFSDGTSASTGDALTPASGEALSDILVTGSRLITNGNDSPTPVTVIQADDLSRIRPGNIADALYSLPAFSGSISQTNTTSPTGSAGGGNPTANTLNLRNIGAKSVLVLFDGQRVVPTLTNQVVDINMIPQMLIQRVDVVTGGASAVYGSDAVSGVVNFIVDKNFNGVKTDINTGTTGRGDDREYRAGIAAGTSLFDGRGHIEGSYNYFDNQGIDQQSDRPQYANVAALGSVPGSKAVPGSAANPLQVFTNVHNAQTSFGGLVSNGLLSGMNFAANGVLSPFARGALTGTANEQIGGDGAYPNTNLVGNLRSNQLYGRFDFTINDRLTWHTSAFFNASNNSSNTVPTTLNPETFSAANPFLAPAYQAELAAAGQGTFQLRKTFQLGTVPYPDLVADETQYQFNTGLDGRLGTYEWGVDVNYGHSKLADTLENNVNNQRLAAALDVVADPVTGQAVCRALANNPGCVPFNAFGPTAASQAAIDYVIGSTDYTPEWTQIDTGGHITGAPFNDWAGPVKVALSAEYRNLTYSATTTPGANPATHADCTGIAYNCTKNTTLWNLLYAPRSSVSNAVKEGAVEFDAPLLKDLPFVKSLEFNGAARYTSYETSGNYLTYKAGLVWHVTDQLTIRGTESRDIRAPTLYELARPEVDVPAVLTDYLTNTTYATTSRDLPAPKDTAEIAKTRTLGVIWQPMPGFSTSLDAYQITIDNAIGQVMGFNQQVQQLCYASGGSSPYCALQTRPSGNFTDTSPANQVTSWLNYFENIAKVETYGADLEMNWSGSAAGHVVSARLLGTYQPHYFYTQLGQPKYDLADVAIPRIQFGGQSNFPSVRVIGMVTVGVTNNFTVNLQHHWRNAMSLTELDAPQENWVPGGNHIRSFGFSTLNMQYDLDQKWGSLSVYGNVRNLFNASAPIGQSLAMPNIGYLVSDDAGMTGRYYTLGIRAKL